MQRPRWVRISVADPEHFDADPDPDPTFQADADPDPNPFIRVRIFFFKSSFIYLESRKNRCRRSRDTLPNKKCVQIYKEHKKQPRYAFTLHLFSGLPRTGLQWEPVQISSTLKGLQTALRHVQLNSEMEFMMSFMHADVG